MGTDDDLRRLFHDDERFDLPVKSGAEDVIVAGARRRRRRLVASATAGTALAVAAVIGVGLALTDAWPSASPPAQEQTETVTPPPATSVSSTSRTTAQSVTSQVNDGPAGQADEQDQPQETEVDEPPPTTPVGELIGPDSFGPVRIGMTFDEAVAAGLITGEPPTPGGGCGFYVYEGGRATVHASYERGVEAIGAKVPVHTPDGVSTGWTLTQVQAVYPEATADLGRARVPVPGSPNLVYRIGFADDVVTDISVQLVDQACYE